MDRFSKKAHFLPCKNSSDASQVTTLFFKQVVRLHVVSRSITLDHNVKFIGHFFRTLWKLLRIHLRFSSAYHPQTNGHIEVVNKSLGNLLKILVREHPKKWAFVIVEFAYNS